MNMAPLARIIARYGVGVVLGMEAGELAAGDPDIVAVIAIVIGLATETAYGFAKRRGWTT